MASTTEPRICFNKDRMRMYPSLGFTTQKAPKQKMSWSEKIDCILIDSSRWRKNQILICWSTYRNSQKHESTLLHMYVLNQFLIADRSCTTKYFFKNRSWYLTYLRFFWHLLGPNWFIIRGKMSLCNMYENGKIAVFEGKWRRFRILPKV